MDVWKGDDNIFSGLFKPTAWIMAAENMTQGFLQSAYDTSRRLGTSEVNFIDAEEIQRRFPAFTGAFQGWTNLRSSEAGWVPSGEMMLRMALAAKKQGVEYITGQRGHVQKLLYDEEGTCIGALSSSGETHTADLIILCTGANTAALIEAKDEIIARSHCVGIIQVSASEAKKYQSLPPVDNFEQGIFFPPDQHGLLKLCSCRFITNYHTSSVPGASLAHSHEDYPNDGIPRVIGQEMREFMRELVPELAGGPWASTRMCWDGDTKDVNFRICPSPTNRNLYIATAGFGHGFKFLPIIGDYIVDMLDGRLAEEYCELWKWRFGATPPKTGKEPHPYPERDLGQLDGWKGGNRGLIPAAELVHTQSSNGQL